MFTGTELVVTDTGMIDTGHASASDANFQDINDMMPDASSTTLSQDAIVVKLNNYQEL